MSVGRRVPDILWDERTTGSLPFVGDVGLPGTLTARVLRSPHPHAEIVSIDTSAAERSPGVVAVVTATDLPDVTYPHDGPMFADRTALARDIVRFVGQEVVAVAAEGWPQAGAALGEIRVKYKLLKQVLTVDEALAPGAPQLHDRAFGPNVALEIDRSYGDRGGRSDAEAVVTGRYRFGRQAHACMETNGTLARWNTESRLLDLWTSTQSPLLVRKEVAYALQLEPKQVHMHEVAVGGGFGSKSKITDHEVIAAALAMKAKRPVRLLLSREEEFATTKSRHDFRVELTTAATADGRLKWRDADIVVDNGAYSHSGPSVTGASVSTMASLYRTDAVHVKARLVDTNKNPGGQFRGYGGPQAHFAIESQMDELAESLGIDPIDLRIRNANLTGDVTQAGWELKSAHLVECLQAAREAIGWDRKRARGGSGRGVGVAVAIHVTGARTYEDANRSTAGVDIRSDGRVRVRFGGSDPGTGQRTVLAQMASNELGVDPSDVEVVMMDSAETPFDLGSWSSRGTFMGGHAASRAAHSAASRLKELAAEKFGADPAMIELGDGRAVAGAESIPIGDLIALSDLEDELRVEETFTVGTEMVNRETGKANLSPSYSFAAHAAEVEVDPGTGEVRVLDYVAAHDCGIAINPLAVEGQIIGGVAMGLGAALGEQLIYEGGRMVNPSYLHYPLPRAADMPPIRPILIEHADPEGPHGAKSVGEVSLDPVPAAIANAVAHAADIRIRDLPLTPDRVLAAMRRRDGIPDRTYRIWRRPSRWWIHFIRWLYPRGLHTVLHRWGTRLARKRPRGAVTALDRPPGLPEAVGVLEAEPSAKLIGGGTDLLPAIEQGLASPSLLVDTSSVSALREISTTADGGLRIGGATTLADLARSRDGEALVVIADTISTIASAQIREMATVAGNLLQEKRCWFYRNEFTCYKRGGATSPCYAVTGDNRFYHAVLGAHRCQAVTPSDLATTLIALEAVAQVTSGKGTRRLALADLYTGPGETGLRRDEILRAIEIPPRAGRRASRFEKLRLWEGDFAVASVCASLDIGDDGRIRKAFIVLGSVAPTPYRATAVERTLVGNTLHIENIEHASSAWITAADPLPGNGWKVDAASALVRRCLEGISAATAAPAP